MNLNRNLLGKYSMNIASRVIAAFIVASFLMLSVTAQAGISRTTTYYHNDHLGSPVATSDASGALVWMEQYAPYGKKYLNGASADESVIGYAGKEFDANTGLTYMNARYYDPDIARFMAIDPVGVLEDKPESFNRYAYANNNPYKYVDPDGKLPILIPLAIFIAKELAAEGASRLTNGATDYLSVRKLGTKALKYGLKKIGRGGITSPEIPDAAKKVDYSSIKNPPNVGPGKDFTPRQKREALELNREANGGIVKSDLSSTTLVKPQKSQRGVTPDPNEWQFDHKTSKNCGGSNCSSNLQVLSRKENRAKSSN